jgi:hypothetical protein
MGKRKKRMELYQPYSNNNPASEIANSEKLSGKKFYRKIL